MSQMASVENKADDVTMLDSNPEMELCFTLEAMTEEELANNPVPYNPFVVKFVCTCPWHT